MHLFSHSFSHPISIHSLGLHAFWYLNYASLVGKVIADTHCAILLFNSGVVCPNVIHYQTKSLYSQFTYSMHFVPAMRVQSETSWTRHFCAILFCNYSEAYPTGFYSRTSKSSTADPHVLCKLQQGRMWSAVSKGIRQLRQAQEGLH